MGERGEDTDKDRKTYAYSAFITRERAWPMGLDEDDILFGGLLTWSEGEDFRNYRNAWYVVARRAPKAPKDPHGAPVVFRLGDLPSSEVTLPGYLTAQDAESLIWHRIDGTEATRAIFEAIGRLKNCIEADSKHFEKALAKARSQREAVQHEAAQREAAQREAAERDVRVLRARVDELEAETKAKETLQDPVPWTRSKEMCEFRAEVIDKYARIFGGGCFKQSSNAFYYGTFEVALDVTSDEAFGLRGTARPMRDRNSNWHRVAAKAFDAGIGDRRRMFAGSKHLIEMTGADTNLQNAGENLFTDELFLVEAMSARVRGIRILYAPSDVEFMDPLASQVDSPANAIVTGQAFLHDLTDDGLFLAGLDRIGVELPKIASNLSLHFTWTDRGIGGSCTTTDALVGSFGDVPGAVGLVAPETPPLALPHGYIWCLDRQFQPTRDAGGNGLFGCELHLEEDASVLFDAKPMFGRSALPVALSVWWEFKLHGTSLIPTDGVSWGHRPLQPRAIR